MVHRVPVSLEKVTIGAFNRLSAGRGLSACLQVKGWYSSFPTTAYMYTIGTGRYITNELYISAYVTRRRATKAKREKERGNKKNEKTREQEEQIRIRKERGRETESGG